MSIDPASMLAYDNVATAPMAAPTASVHMEQERSLGIHLVDIQRQTLKDRRRTAALVRALNRLVTVDGQRVTVRDLPYRSRKHARTGVKPVAWNSGTSNAARNPQPLSGAAPSAHSAGFDYITATEYTRTVVRERGKAQFRADKTARRARDRAARVALADGGQRNTTLQVVPVASHWA